MVMFPGIFSPALVKKSEIEINKVGKENAQLFCIGKKGYEHFNKRNYNIINHYYDKSCIADCNALTKDVWS